MASPLDLLYEADGLPAFPLPAGLERLYGGPLGFAEPCVVANFVSSLDGAVALPGVPGAVRMIGDGSEADRFVMALVRACAGAILMGAGTFRASREARWTPDSLYPAETEAFAELRRRLGYADAPELAVVTRSGRVDPEHPAFAGGVLVMTTDQLAAPLEEALPEGAEVVSLGENVDVRDAVSVLSERGHRVVLTEGGPTMFGSLLDAGAVDELFLTLSPVVAGARADAKRLSLVEGVGFLPHRRLAGELLTVRRQGAHLFLRYALGAE